MEEKVDIHVGGYHLTESVGTGGMGSVFRATVEAEGKALAVGETVAVKLLHPHLRNVEGFVERFHREARLAAKMNHPNIIRVIDEGAEDKHHFIVMEFADGTKLSDMMADGQPFSPQQTIEIMSQICEALKAAGHIEDPDEPGRVRSLVHRDIKPDNIIILPADNTIGTKASLASLRVKLLDFGLAKDVEALSSIISQAGQSLGTPAYMSPEQCNGGDVDTRSDLYSVGVCAYRMVTGVSLFTGPSTVAYAQQHSQAIPADILKHNPLCPKNLADCIHRLLAKNPRDRYQSPDELQKDLARVAEGKPVSKVHKFKKPGGSKRKVAVVAGNCNVLTLTVLAGGWFMWTDHMKSNVADAIRLADVAAANGEYAEASNILADAIDSVPDRPDREELIKPASERLEIISAKAVEKESQRRSEELLAQQRVQAVEAEKARKDRATRKLKHEQDAIKAEARIKASIAAGQFDKAIEAARKAMDDYSDTPSLKAISNKLAKAEAGKKAHQDAEERLAAAERKRELKREAAQHAAFVKYRDHGISAMNRKDYNAAIRAFDQALAEEENLNTQKLRKKCVEKITRHRIAIADFSVKGDVGIRGAGETVPELMLAEFGQERYQLVERSQLSVILNEQDLTMADIVSNPALLRGKKLKGLRYLVLGSVVKLGSLAISARLVDVTTGDMVQTAKITAGNATELQDALGELAKLLQMTPAEKKAYLDDTLYPKLLANARQMARQRLYTSALSTYRRVLAIRSTAPIRSEFRGVEANKAAWEKSQVNRRQKELRRAERLKRNQRQFDSLLFKARLKLARMPKKTKDLTSTHKRDLKTAQGYVKDALRLKPSDAKAMSYSKYIAKMLKANQYKITSYDGGKYLGIGLGNGQTMKLMRIPSGKFLMGSKTSKSESPLHWVTMPHNFYLGACEVTQEQWQAVMGNNPSTMKGPRRPVDHVSWYDATEFCRRLSKKTGKVFRLPSEAEREYACRAGTRTRFSFGNSDKFLYKYANYCDLSNTNGFKWQDKKHRDGHDKTANVGSFKPNAYGLYDMHGNLWEWCSDWYGNYSSRSVTNPLGPSRGKYRVYRGGGWNNTAWVCRSANRYRDKPTTRNSLVGFRIVYPTKIRPRK